MKKIKTINISYELDTEDVPTVIISEVIERTNGYGQKRKLYGSNPYSPRNQRSLRYKR